MAINILTGRPLSQQPTNTFPPTLSSVLGVSNGWNAPTQYGGVMIQPFTPPNQEELGRINSLVSDPSVQARINSLPQPMIASSQHIGGMVAPPDNALQPAVASLPTHYGGMMYPQPEQTIQSTASTVPPMNYQTWLSKYGNNAVNPATGQYWGYQDMMADSGLPESLINVYSAQMRKNYNAANQIPGIAPDNIPNMTDWYRATQAGYDPQTLISGGNGGNGVQAANTPVSLTQLLSGATRFPRNPTIPENGMGLLSRLLNRTGY